MIDIHTHILPDVDDGSINMLESIAMARIAYNDGINTIVATPHVLRGVFANSRDKILAGVEALNKTLLEYNIAVNILPGAEYYLEPDLALSLSRGELLTINDNGRYLLVELPFALIPEYADQVLYEIQLQGVTPIIAHPERNLAFAAQPALLEKMTQRGILAQITSNSICGYFGKQIKKTALSFLKQGIVHLVASDAHNSKNRAPILSQAAQEIAKHFNSNFSQQLLRQNPTAIVEGKEIENPLEKQGDRPKLLRSIFRFR